LFRVTQNTFLGNIRTQLARGGRRLLINQERVASGRQINHPSDDPSGAYRVMGLKAVQARNDQYARNLSSVTSRLNVSENVLHQSQEVLFRSQELAIQAANGSLDAEQRQVIATEVTQQLDEVKRLANSELGGRYLFGGYRTDRPPFVRDLTVAAEAANTGSGTIATGTFDPEAVSGSRYRVRFTTATTYEVVELGTNSTTATGSYTDGAPINFDGQGNEVAVSGVPVAGDSFLITPHMVYRGDGNDSLVSVGEGQTVTANVHGHQFFLGDSNMDGTTDSGRVSLFGSLETLKFALENNDVDTVQTVITQVNQAVGQMSEGQGVIGGRLNMVDSAQNDLSQRTITIEGLRSQIEDADMAVAITDLSQAEAVYQATLGTAARVLQRSLLDYL